MKYIAIEDGWSEQVLGVFNTEAEANKAVADFHNETGSRVFVREHVNYRVVKAAKTTLTIGTRVRLKNGLTAGITKVKAYYYEALVECDNPYTICCLTSSDVAEI